MSIWFERLLPRPSVFSYCRIFDKFQSEKYDFDQFKGLKCPISPDFDDKF
jgi:hypothetical protein